MMRAVLVLTLAAAWAALLLAVRAVYRRERAWRWTAGALVCSLAWPLALPRTGVDRWIGFWLVACLALGGAWVARRLVKRPAAS